MRRMLALALCLMLMGPAALAKTYVVENYGTDESPGCNLLIRDDGTLLTPDKPYNSIYEITPEGTPESERRFAVTPAEINVESAAEDEDDLLYSTDYVRLALMDSRGRLLTGFDYDNLDYENGYVIFTLPEKDRPTGAMDSDGHVVLEAEYAMVVPLTEGRWLAVQLPERYDAPSGAPSILSGDDGEATGEDLDYAFGEDRYALSFIDASGTVRDLGLHTRDRYVNVSADGVCVMWNVIEYGDQMLYLSPDGEVMFDRGFGYADSFEGDYAIIDDGDRYGVIDRSGAFALPQIYDYITRQRGNLVIATRDSAFEVYDPADMSLLMTMELPAGEDFDVAAVSNGLIGVVQGETKRLFDLSGALLTEFGEGEYLQLYGYPDGDITRLIAGSGEWPDEHFHLIDLAGNPASDDYRIISECLWRQDEGRFVIGTYDVMNAAEQSSVDWTSFRYGLIDQDGNTLLQPVYDELRPLDFDRLWAVQGDRHGLIDATGKWYFSLSDYEELMD